VPFVTCILYENGNFQKVVHLYQVLLETGQKCYRNLRDAETCFQGGNNEQNSKFKSGVTSVNKEELSEWLKM
jgi:hypothetical protein